MTADCVGCSAILDRWRRKADAEGLDREFPAAGVLLSRCRDCGGQPLLALAVETSLAEEVRP